MNKFKVNVQKLKLLNLSNLSFKNFKIIFIPFRTKFEYVQVLSINRNQNYLNKIVCFLRKEQFLKFQYRDYKYG